MMLILKLMISMVTDQYDACDIDNAEENDNGDDASPQLALTH